MNKGSKYITETDLEDENRRNNLSLIDSIMEPGSASFAALTQEQRDGLSAIKQSNLHALLNNSRSNDEKIRAYIPNRLLTPKDDTQKYLLAEFGGIQKKHSNSIHMMQSTFKSVMIANKFVSKFSYFNKKPKEIADDKYAKPAEWHLLDHQTQTELAKCLSWENLSKWDFDIFEVSKLCKGQPILFVGWAVLSSPYSQFAMQEVNGETDDDVDSMEGYCFLDDFEIPGKVMIDWLRAMEKEYLDVPYHNNVHASDVLQSLHALVVKMDKEEFDISQLQYFCIMVSAIIHDLGHTGYNNNYQCNSLTDTALAFNDSSVMENFHVSLFFQKMLGKNNDATINIFDGMNRSTVIECRKLIIESVLGTDMSNHFASVARMKDMLTTSVNADISSETKKKMKFDNEASWFVLHFLMHVADISNCAKALNTSRQWTDRVLKEFFRQGDKEKEEELPVSPLCDRLKVSRPGSQVGFIDFIVRPTFEIVAQLLPKAEEMTLPIIEKNYEYWQSEELADVLRNCSTTV